MSNSASISSLFETTHGVLVALEFLGGGSNGWSFTYLAAAARSCFGYGPSNQTSEVILQMLVELTMVSSQHWQGVFPSMLVWEMVGHRIWGKTRMGLGQIQTSMDLS